MVEEYNVNCIKGNKKLDAIIQANEYDDDVELIFLLGDLKISKRADNFFEALVEIRRELEEDDIKLLCKGCCMNVYPSAMLLGMGAGEKAYVLNLGEQAKMSSLVNIFETCKLEEYASISEQYNFFNKWCGSKKEKR